MSLPLEDYERLMVMALESGDSVGVLVNKTIRKYLEENYAEV